MPEFTQSESPPKSGERPPGARLLPWPDPEGRPAYLAPGSNNGTLARLADSVEADQLHDAAIVLDHSLYVLGNDAAPETELRFVAERLAECLTNALHVAHSRGERLTPNAGQEETR
jgi:hypothetical protein